MAQDRYDLLAQRLSAEYDDLPTTGAELKKWFKDDSTRAGQLYDVMTKDGMNTGAKSKDAFVNFYGSGGYAMGQQPVNRSAGQKTGASLQDSQTTPFTQPSFNKQPQQETEEPVDYPRRPTSYTDQGALFRLNDERTQRNADIARNVLEQNPVIKEQKRKSQPVTTTGTPADQYVIKTQGQFEDEVHQSAADNARKLFGTGVDYEVGRVIDDATKRWEKAFDPRGMVGEGAEISALTRANQEIDPERLTQDLTNELKNRIGGWLQQEGKPDALIEEANRLGISPDDYANMVVNEITSQAQNKLNQKVLEGYMPKGKADYIINGLHDSLIGTLMDMTTMTKGQRQMMQRANQQYSKQNKKDSQWGGTITDLVRGGVGFMGDAPVFGALGKVASPMVRGTGALLENMGVRTTMGMSDAAFQRLSQTVLNNSSWLQRMKFGADRAIAGSAYNFGLYEGMGNVVNDLSVGDDTSLGTLAGDFIEGFAKGSAKGAVLGAFSRPAQAVSPKFGVRSDMGIGQKVLVGTGKGALATGNIMAEGLGFTAGEYLVDEAARERVKNSDNPLDVIKQDTMENTMMAGIFKIMNGHNMLHPVESMRKAFDAPADSRFRFQDWQKKEIEDAYGSKESFVKTMEDIARSADSERNTKMSRFYEDFMNRNDISWDTKNKVSALLTGNMATVPPIPSRISIDQDKKEVVAFGRNGEVLFRRGFENQEDADAIKAQLDMSRDEQMLHNLIGTFLIKDKDGNVNPESQKQLDDAITEIGFETSLNQEGMINALNKAPEKRTEMEQHAIDELFNRLYEVRFPANQPHPAQDHQDGRDLADQTLNIDELDPAKNPNGVEPGKYDQLTQAYDEANKTLEEVFKKDDTFYQFVKEQRAKGLTDGEIALEARKMAFGEEEAQALIDYERAKEQMNGYIELTAERIGEYVSNEVSGMVFKGELDGQPVNDRFVRVVDDEGNTYYLRTGKVTVGEDGRLVSTDESGTVIVRDANGKDKMVRADSVSMAPEDPENPMRDNIAAYSQLRSTQLEEAISLAIDADGKLQQPSEPKSQGQLAYEQEQGDVEQNGGLVRNDLADQTLSETLRGSLHQLGRKIGKKIQVVTKDELKQINPSAPDNARGMRSADNKTLYLVSDYVKDSDYMQRFVTGHELTHSIKAESGDGKVWNSFVDAVREHMGDKAFDEAVKHVEDLYEKSGVHLDRNGAIEEVCSDWAGDNLMQDEASIRHIVESMEKAGHDAVTFTQRVKQLFNDMIAAITGSGRTLSSDEKAQLERLVKARDLWEQMYNECVAKNEARDKAAEAKRLAEEKAAEERKAREDNGVVFGADGEADYLRMTPDATIADLSEQAGPELVGSVVGTMLKNAEKALKGIKDVKPASEKPSDVIAAAKETAAMKKSAQEAVDYWKSVSERQKELEAEAKAEAKRKAEEEARLQAEAERQERLKTPGGRAAEIAKAKVEDRPKVAQEIYGEAFNGDMTPNGVDEYIMSYFGGEIPELGKGFIDTDSFESETGHKVDGFNGDSKAYYRYLAGRGKGKTLKQVAEEIWHSMPEAMHEMTNDADIMNKVSQLLTNADKTTDIRDALLNSRIREAERVLSGESRKAEEQEAEAEVEEPAGGGMTTEMPFAPFEGEAPFSLEKAAEQNGASYSLVEDPAEIDRLDKEKKIKVYRSVQLDKDGNARSPIASKLGKGSGKVATSGIEIGQWEKADEHPELADESGKIVLDKGDGNGSLTVAYNPYIHTSRSMINDQFSSAWKRDNIVVIETEVPESELTAGYHADKAKDAVGEHAWKAGPVGRKLPEDRQRKVILSRWDKPVRTVSWEEVADDYARTLEGLDIEVPFNVIPKSLLPLLVERGIKIGEPEKGNAGDASREAYEAWKKESVMQGQPMFSLQGDGEPKSQKKQMIESRDSDEAKEFPKRMQDWLSEENLSKARGKKLDEIVKMFGNDPQPVAFVPKESLSVLGEGITDNRIYSGMGYFIDHAVNHHPSIEAGKYNLIQDVLSAPDDYKEIIRDGKRSVAFIKKIDRYNAVVVEVERTPDGKIIWHKSFFDQKKKPYAKYPSIRPNELSSGGGVSPISHSDDSTPNVDKSVPGSSLPTPDDIISDGKDSKNSYSLQENKEEKTKINTSDPMEAIGQAAEDFRKKQETDKIFNAAKKLFGTTKDVREAGYILPDGTMPDFSGRHLMNPGSDTSFLRGRRTTDHREVESLAYEKDGNTKTGIKTDMPDFIKRGAIRIDDNAGNINLATKPTDKQKSILRQIISRNDGFVQIDFGDGWNSDHYVEYDGAKPSKILADIDRYFDEGIKPQSEPKYSLGEVKETDGENRVMTEEQRKEERKKAQFDIIQKTNPKDKDLNHTWIEKPEDVKTFQETFEDGSYDINEDLTPDFTSDMAKKAIETGEIKVYSSHRIKDGEFVTPSEMEAKNYAGEGKVYSKNVPLEDVAWIDPTQGQYAKVDDSKYSLIGSKGAESMDKAEGTTLRIDNRRTAEEMEKAGKDSKAIWAATGWARGKDGKWRYEIPDFKEFSAAGIVEYKKEHPATMEERKKFTELNYKKVDGEDGYGEPLTEEELQEWAGLKAKINPTGYAKEQGKLPDFIDAPELFEAYPALRDMPVEVEDLGGEFSGMYTDDGSILLDKSRVDKAINGSFDESLSANAELKDTMVHEIQHAIQAIEGFARGDNPHRLVSGSEIGDDAYNRSAGEVEARNTEKRRFMSERHRKKTIPEKSEDTPREDQIVYTGESDGEKFSLTEDTSDPIKTIERASKAWKVERKVFGTKPKVHAETSHGGRVAIEDNKEPSIEDEYVHYSLSPSPTNTPLQTDENRRYHELIGGKAFDWIEAHQNDLQSVIAMQKAILGDNVDAKDYENVFYAMNHMGGVVMQKENNYARHYYSRINNAANEAAAKMRGNDKNKKYQEAMDEVEDYIMMKHGLERNRSLYVRDHADDQAKADFANLMDSLYNDLRARRITFADYLSRMDDFIRSRVDSGYTADKHDMSGLSNKNAAGYDDAAMTKEVMDTEALYGEALTDELWDSINSATDYILNERYESGLMSKAEKERLERQWHFYVPLQGWAEPTAEEMFDYTDHMMTSVGSPVLKRAGGRTSKADDPLAMIGANASRLIRDAELNRVHQTAVRLSRGHAGNGLLEEMQTWYEKTGTDASGNPIWEEAFPKWAPNATADDITQAIQQFNADMQAKQQTGDARKIKRGLNIRYPMAVPSHVRQHIINAWIGGEKVRLYVQGNPRAAQALNGELRQGTDNKFVKGWDAVNRLMMGLNTSYNPEFIVSNGERDLEMATNNLLVKEGREYTGRFLKNYFGIGGGNTTGNTGLLKGETLGMGSIGKRIDAFNGIWNRYYNNALDMSKDSDRMFKEFMDNGGPTGYVTNQNLDKYKKQLYQGVREKDGNVVVKAMTKLLADPFSWALNSIEELNTRVENLTRFAAYQTSRQGGRSILQSIHDAKEVSVNFGTRGAGGNTSGAAGATAAWGRHTFYFYNAGVQSLEMYARNIRKHPIKGVATMMLKPFMAGCAVALWNMLNGADDETGEKSYAQLNPWVRRNNLIIPAGDGAYWTYPLPIEIRAFYGMGEAAAGMFFEETRDPNPALTMAGQVTQMVPIDVLSYMSEQPKDITDLALRFGTALLPSVIQSDVVQPAVNMNFYGAPIEKEPNPFDEFQPRWGRTFMRDQNTSVYRAAKWLEQNTRTSPSEHSDPDSPEMTKQQKGYIDISPALAKHMIDNIFGGTGAWVMRLGDATRNGWEWLADDGDNPMNNSRSIPFVRTNYRSATHDRGEGRQRARMYELNKMMKNVEDNLKFYYKDKDVNPEHYLRFMELWDSEDGQIYRDFHNDLKTIDSYERKVKQAPEGEAKRNAQQQLNEKRRVLLEQIDKKKAQLEAK